MSIRTIRTGVRILFLLAHSIRFQMGYFTIAATRGLVKPAQRAIPVYTCLGKGADNNATISLTLFNTSL
jgi:hypothetical protein